MPKAVSVGSGGIEIKIPMVRVKEHVGIEVVVVPYESVLEVFPNGMPIDVSEIFLHHKAVERPDNGIHAQHGGDTLPQSLLAIIG